MHFAVPFTAPFPFTRRYSQAPGQVPTAVLAAIGRIEGKMKSRKAHRAPTFTASGGFVPYGDASLLAELAIISDRSGV
ncbi:MAG: hypothetical protein RIS17_1613 [Pseudomonadota bacterium]